MIKRDTADVFIRYFGIELEYTVSPSILTLAAEQAILKHSDHPLSKRENIKSWCVKPEHCGSEITTPKLEFTKANLDMVCKITNEIKISLKKYSKKNKNNYIKNNCGFHLHIDSNIKSRNKKAWIRFFKIFHMMEDAIFAIVPAHRRKNRCVRTLNNEFKCFGEYIPYKKFLSVHKVNNSHIEIRHAPSTLDSNYVFQWIAFSQVMVEIAEGFANNISNNIPKPTTCNHMKNLINFIKENDHFIKTQWLKCNMQKMFNWIKREHNKNYKLKAA